MVPQLRRWLNWEGKPAVSLAVSLNKDAALAGRLYNFLPMSERATAPLMGYLDAPFFADIDRRSTNLNLPLNETLLEAAAEACAASAIWIVEQQIDVPPHVVFDLVAWTGEHASKLDVALKDLGTTLEKAPVIPAIAVDGRNGWSSLSGISLWPSGHYAVLNARDAARRIGARLVSLDLGDQRIQRLKQLAVRAKVNLVPGGEQLSDWAEQFAATLLARNASARTWSQYYDDLKRLFGEVKADLTALAHKRILLDRLGRLRAAGTHGADGQSKVFVRVEGTQRRRSPGGVPLPPRTLARRFHFLDERISLAEETLSAFRKAGLLRVYDPIEALVGLKGALGQKANEKRRKEALVWAFQVWRLAGSRVDDALQKAGLYVPTHSGWLPARRAAFSASWTGLGSTLENYLVEVAGFSADCRHARARLLIPYANWPEASQDSKRQWVRFLEVLGVVDGLRPIPGHIIRKGSPANYWDGLLRSGKPSEGLDDDWCAEASRVHFSYPYTDYEIRGQAWRLPGQIEHAQLSDAAKEALSSLIFEHLKVRGKEFFQFKVGRFERAERAWDARSLPTPMATFLRSKPWLAVNARDEIVFRRPSECWATRERRRGSGPPRFLDRLPEKFAADVAENTSMADLMFGESIGLRDWQSETTAVVRLSDLALATPDLSGSDRPVFRREYQRAWLDAAGTQITFPLEDPGEHPGTADYASHRWPASLAGACAVTIGARPAIR